MDQLADRLTTYLRSLGYSAAARGARVQVDLSMGTKLRVDLRDPSRRVRTRFGFIPALPAMVLSGAIAIGILWIALINRQLLGPAVPTVAAIVGWDAIRYSRSRPAAGAIRAFLRTHAA